ncbi:hypothetical protein BRC83_07255 [Halobacteriales archaeon QS_1_68_17]|nr:MAG: hypothetical protein BRC83_07255 [Halobacteriales archaeon QS_1_68_17]
MATLKHTPGPAAGRAFKLGMIAVVVAALGALGLLYALGHLSLTIAGYALVLVFPMYLVVAASVLSVWLGYDKDVTDLRPVYREKEA